MRKLENKGADQLYGNHTHFKPLATSVVVQPGLCRIWSEIPETGFLMMRHTAHIVKRYQTTCQHHFNKE